MGCRDKSLRISSNAYMGQVELSHANRKAGAQSGLYADRQNRSHVGIWQEPGFGAYR